MIFSTTSDVWAVEDMVALRHGMEATHFVMHW